MNHCHFYWWKSNPSMSTFDMKCVPCRIKLHFIETAKVNFNTWLLQVFASALYGMENNLSGNERLQRRLYTHCRKPYGTSHFSGCCIPPQWVSHSSLSRHHWTGFHLRRNKEQGVEKRSGESLSKQWCCWWWVLEKGLKEIWRSVPWHPGALGTGSGAGKMRDKITDWANIFYLLTRSLLKELLRKP